MSSSADSTSDASRVRVLGTASKTEGGKDLHSPLLNRKSRVLSTKEQVKALLQGSFRTKEERMFMMMGLFLTVFMMGMSIFWNATTGGGYLEIISSSFLSVDAEYARGSVSIFAYPGKDGLPSNGLPPGSLSGESPMTTIEEALLVNRGETSFTTSFSDAVTRMLLAPNFTRYAANYSARLAVGLPNNFTSYDPPVNSDTPEEVVAPIKISYRNVNSYDLVEFIVSNLLGNSALAKHAAPRWLRDAYGETTTASSSSSTAVAGGSGSDDDDDDEDSPPSITFFGAPSDESYASSSDADIGALMILIMSFFGYFMTFYIMLFAGKTVKSGIGKDVNLVFRPKARLIAFGTFCFGSIAVCTACIVILAVLNLPTPDSPSSGPIWPALVWNTFCMFSYIRFIEFSSILDTSSLPIGFKILVDMGIFLVRLAVFTIGTFPIFPLWLQRIFWIVFPEYNMACTMLQCGFPAKTADFPIPLSQTLPMLTLQCAIKVALGFLDIYIEFEKTGRLAVVAGSVTDLNRWTIINNWLGRSSPNNFKKYLMPSTSSSSHQLVSETAAGSSHIVVFRNLVKDYDLEDPINNPDLKSKKSGDTDDGEEEEPKNPAVDGLTLEVKRGEIFGLLGHNGAGKTTTFQILAGQLAPTSLDSGSIDGVPLGDENCWEALRHKIGLCPQGEGGNMDSGTSTVIEALSQFYFFRHGHLDKDEILRVLEDLKLSDEKDKAYTSLTGGMRRRLSLARAILTGADLLLFDEPSSGLDPSLRRELWSFMKQLKQQGKTIIFTTHYMDEAEVLSDRLAILAKGKVQCIGTPSELKRMNEVGYYLTAYPLDHGGMGGIKTEQLLSLTNSFALNARVQKQDSASSASSSAAVPTVPAVPHQENPLDRSEDPEKTSLLSGGQVNTHDSSHPKKSGNTTATSKTVVVDGAFTQQSEEVVGAVTLLLANPDVDKYGAFLTALEPQLSSLGIDYYTLRMNSLEDVFVQLAIQLEKEEEAEKKGKKEVVYGGKDSSPSQQLHRQESYQVASSDLTDTLYGYGGWSRAKPNNSSSAARRTSYGYDELEEGGGAGGTGGRENITVSELADAEASVAGASRFNSKRQQYQLKYQLRTGFKKDVHSTCSICCSVFCFLFVAFIPFTGMIVKSIVDTVDSSSSLAQGPGGSSDGNNVDHAIADMNYPDYADWEIPVLHQPNAHQQKLMDNISSLFPLLVQHFPGGHNSSFTSQGGDLAPTLRFRTITTGEFNAEFRDTPVSWTSTLPRTDIQMRWSPDLAPLVLATSLSDSSSEDTDCDASTTRRKSQSCKFIAPFSFAFAPNPYFNPRITTSFWLLMQLAADHDASSISSSNNGGIPPTWLNIEWDSLSNASLITNYNNSNSNNNNQQQASTTSGDDDGSVASTSSSSPSSADQEIASPERGYLSLVVGGAFVVLTFLFPLIRVIQEEDHVEALGYNKLTHLVGFYIAGLARWLILVLLPFLIGCGIAGFEPIAHSPGAFFFTILALTLLFLHYAAPIAAFVYGRATGGLLDSDDSEGCTCASALAGIWAAVKLLIGMAYFIGLLEVWMILGFPGIYSSQFAATTGAGGPYSPLFFPWAPVNFAMQAFIASRSYVYSNNATTAANVSSFTPADQTGMMYLDDFTASDNPMVLFGNWTGPLFPLWNIPLQLVIVLIGLLCSWRNTRGNIKGRIARFSIKSPSEFPTLSKEEEKAKRLSLGAKIKNAVTRANRTVLDRLEGDDGPSAPKFDVEKEEQRVREAHGLSSFTEAHPDYPIPLCTPENYHTQDMVSIVNARKFFEYSSASNELKGGFACDGITIGVRQGEILSLLGPNGAGKSTLISLLLRTAPPCWGFVKHLPGLGQKSGGEILEPSSIDEENLIYRLGYCDQNLEFSRRGRADYSSSGESSLTAHEIMLRHLQVRLGAVFDHYSPEGWDSYVETCLIHCGLKSIKDQKKKKLSELSGGNLRKVRVCVALFTGSRLSILDEPTTSMDPFARRHIWKAIRAAASGGVNTNHTAHPAAPARSVLLSTHNMQEAEAVSHRVSILLRGKVRCVGTPAELKNRFAKGYTVTFELVPPETVADDDHHQAIAETETATTTPSSPSSSVSSRKVKAPTPAILSLLKEDTPPPKPALPVYAQQNSSSDNEPTLEAGEYKSSTEYFEAMHRVISAKMETIFREGKYDADNSGGGVAAAADDGGVASGKEHSSPGIYDGRKEVEEVETRGQADEEDDRFEFVEGVGELLKLKIIPPPIRDSRDEKLASSEERHELGLKRHSLAFVFALLSRNKEAWGIAHYSVTQVTSLEQVFVRFTDESSTGGGEDGEDSTTTTKPASRRKKALVK